MARHPKSSAVGNLERVGLRSGASTLHPEFLVKQLPRVVQIARRIHSRLPKSVAIDDLVNSGVIGLLHAARKFDDTKHVEFGQYAKFRIRGAILDSLREMDWGPRTLRRQSRRLQEAHQQLSMRLGRLPTQPEVAAELQMTLDDFHVLTRDLSGLATCSLDSPVNTQGETTPLHERLTNPKGDLPYDSLLRSETQKLLNHLLGELPETPRRVITHYYFEGLTMKEVGKLLGRTESRVSQIHGDAIEYLRMRLEEMNGLRERVE